MSVDDMQAQPEQSPSPIRVESLDEVLQALLRAVRQTAENGAMAEDDRDSKDLGQAALSYAQAYAVLDPDRLVGGDTPEARRDAIPPATTDADGDGQIGEQ